jgi:hypothetical protein
MASVLICCALAFQSLLLRFLQAELRRELPSRSLVDRLGKGEVIAIRVDDHDKDDADN